MIKPYPRFSITCQDYEFAPKIHFPVNPWLFSRLFQFSSFTFGVKPRMGIYPTRRLDQLQVGYEEKVCGVITENWGIRTQWAWLFTRVTERAFGGVYKTGTGYVATPVRMTLPGSSSCKCPAIMCLVVIISWSLEQEPDWLTTHVRMTVQTTRAKGTGNLSMRKQTHWRIYETLVFHFYKLSWWLKMFPFLTLKTEMPRPNWVNEILSRIIYRNIKRVSDIQCFQAKMIISAPDNLNIQEIR